MSGVWLNTYVKNGHQKNMCFYKIEIHAKMDVYHTSKCLIVWSITISIYLHTFVFVSWWDIRSGVSPLTLKKQGGIPYVKDVL